MRVVLSDAFGSTWISMFDEAANVVIGRPAGELFEAQERNEAEYVSMLKEVIGRSFIFKCKAMSETYNDETRVKIQAVRAEPLDFASEAKKLTELIKQFGL